MQDKQVDPYNEMIEKMSLAKLEQEILKLYPAYLKGKCQIRGGIYILV